MSLTCVRISCLPCNPSDTTGDNGGNAGWDRDVVDLNRWYSDVRHTLCRD